MLAVLGTLFAGSAAYFVWKCFAFEYADLSTDKLTLDATVGKIVLYGVALFEVCTGRTVTLLTPLLTAAIMAVVLRCTRITAELFLLKYRKTVKQFDNADPNEKLSSLSAAVLLALLRGRFEDDWVVVFCRRHAETEKHLISNRVDSITSSASLQFVVEWTLLQNRPIEAFFLFYAHQRKCSQLVGAFLRL